MALVICPECGKGNISDSALACPYCGFGVKTYFDKISLSKATKKKTEEKQKASEEEKKIMEKRRLEHEKMLKEHPKMAQAIKEKELENAKKKSQKAEEEKVRLVQQLTEQKKSEIKSKTLGLLWSIFWTIVCIWSFSASVKGSLGLLIVVSFFLAAIGWGMLILTMGSVEQINKDIKIASQSIEEYIKVLNIRSENLRIESEKRKIEESLKHIKCPMCGSLNTQKISTFNRAVSVSAIGLASSKIGKQYECKNCKHKW